MTFLVINCESAKELEKDLTELGPTNAETMEKRNTRRY